MDTITVDVCTSNMDMLLICYNIKKKCGIPAYYVEFNGKWKDLYPDALGAVRCGECQVTITKITQDEIYYVFRLVGCRTNLDMDIKSTYEVFVDRVCRNVNNEHIIKL